MKTKITFLGLVLAALSVSAGTTINSANKYAYGANLGWIDFRGDTNNGAVIGDFICSGYIYSANVGWINLGGGNPANGIRYQNIASNDFGVNHDGIGNLRGFAYGANIGWINFESNGAPRVDLLTGRLIGSAYSANCGWISLSNSVAFVQTDTISPGQLGTNGLPLAWERTYFGTTNIDPNADPDNDGMSNAQEYLAGTNPTNNTDFLRITAFTLPPGGTNVSFTWTTVPTRLYRIQESTSLTAPVWTDSILGLISPSGATTSRNFTDSFAPIRFYRIRAIRPLVP